MNERFYFYPLSMYIQLVCEWKEWPVGNNVYFYIPRSTASGSVCVTVLFLLLISFILDSFCIPTSLCSPRLFR